MGNFGLKIEKFLEVLIERRGFVKVLEGLQNTLIIAVLGLIIGIVSGAVVLRGGGVAAFFLLRKRERRDALLTKLKDLLQSAKALIKKVPALLARIPSPKKLFKKAPAAQTEDTVPEETAADATEEESSEE